MAYPEPSNVAPWYLRNITQALALDETTGNVYVRTGFTGNIVIEGNVNIPGNIDAHVVELGNIDISGNTMPVSGNINIDAGNVTVLQGTDPWVVSGNVTSTLSGNLAGITGNVTIVDGGGAITVDGTVNIGTMPNVNAAVSGNVGITGNVNIGTMPEVEIKNDTGNPIPVSANTTENSVTNPIYVEGVNNASFFAPTQADAFGRLRVSNPQTLFDTQNRYYNHNQFASNVAGGGTYTYNSNDSTIAMAVTGASGDAVYSETYKVFPYQPGKSLLIYATFCMNSVKANLVQRVGYFSSQNGIFFEQDGSTLNMVIRSYSSGSIVEDRVPQSSWNGDPLNGAGPSGITLNPALDQIFFCDIEWLGVGSVRTGFVIGGQYIVAHTFDHANMPGNTTTYMSTASLPVRYEIVNTGATGSSSTLRQICSSVMSEGGYTLEGQPRSIGHALASPITLPNDQSFKPLLSIRLKSTCPDSIVLPKFYTIAPTAQSTFKYRIYNGRSITTGGTWTDIGSDSPVQYNLAPTAISSGTIVAEGFIISSNQTAGAPTQVGFGFENQLQRDSFTGTMYEYVLAAATTGTNQTVYASIEWQEVN